MYLGIDHHKKRLRVDQLLDGKYADRDMKWIVKQAGIILDPPIPNYYEHYTPNQLKAHYDIEKALANKLRNSNREERRILYSSLYNELFRKVPHHPQLKLKQKVDTNSRPNRVNNIMRYLSKFLKPEHVFLEIGPGDCQLSFEVTKHVMKVYAIDVSEAVTKCLQCPDNFQLILSDGSSIDVPRESINIAYSNQLMEHLHPEDAETQLSGVYDSLVPGGVYICCTPHRFYGPHDVSKYFDEVAQGFHLKEYTYTDLAHLFSAVGFKKIYSYNRNRDDYYKIPTSFVLPVEKTLELFSKSFRKKFNRRPINFLFSMSSILLIAIK